MKRYVFPLQTSILFLLFLQSLIVMESNIKQYFWVAIIFISIISYIYQGARPYSPLFFFIAIADYFELDTVQISILVLIGLLVVFLEFYHIQIVGKGPYNAGYRYIKTDNYELSVFYPSMNDGQHAKWIPSETYSSALYDITYVNPCETRMPFRIFNFILSYLFKLKMPVLGDATLYTNDSIKQQKWSVIVFSHGLGSNLNNYSALCGWWASHGYIVVSIQHNHDLIRIQFPSELMKQPDILEKIFYKSRNNDLKIRSKEMETILEEILEKDLLGGIFKEKKILIERVFLAGHSYGGGTALETMANLIEKQKDHSKISGLICLDAWFFPLSQSTYQNLKDQNILLIHSQTFFSVVPFFYYMQQKLKRLKSVNQQTMKPFVVTNTDHLSISDFVFTFGRLFQLMKTVRMQAYAKPILQLHQIMIALFMSGKSKEEIMKISNHYSEKYDIAKRGVKVVEQWRYSKVEKK